MNEIYSNIAYIKKWEAPSFMCLYVGYGKCLIRKFDEKLLEGKTTRQIECIVGGTDGFLAIVYPWKWIRLDPDCIPLSKYPELIPKNRDLSDTSEIPVHFKWKPATEDADVGYDIQVTTQMDEKFPNMTISFRMGELENVTVKNLVAECVKTFGYESEMGRLEVNGAIVADNIPGKQLLDNIGVSQLVFACEIGENGMNAVALRVHKCKDLIASENVYVMKLTELMSYWKPKIESSKVFTTEENHRIFQFVPAILNLQRTFQEDLLTVSSGFDANVGKKMLSFVELLRMNMSFVSGYKTVADMIEKKNGKDGRNANAKLAEIDEKSPDGCRFLDVYIVPVQRAPRYSLLVRDILKATPVWHPDYEYLLAATTAFDLMNRKVDFGTYQREHANELDDVRTMLGSQWKYSGQRILERMRVEITVDGVANNGEAILFDDSVVIGYVANDEYQSIVGCSLEYFRFANVWRTSKEIAVRTDYGDYIVAFCSSQERRTWLKKFSARRDAKIVTTTRPKGSVKWTEFDIDRDLPIMNGHDGCVVENKAFFIGRIVDSDSLSCGAVVYDQASNTWKGRECQVPVRNGHTVVHCGSSPVLCFGEMINVCINDVWQIEDDCVRHAIVNGNKVTPRMNHSCCGTDSCVIIFGGEDEDGRLLNDLCYIDINADKAEFFDWGGAPQPRKNHAAVYIKEFEQLVIVGGRTANGLVGDIYTVTEKGKKWGRKSSLITPREFHRMEVMGDYIIVIGGTGDNGVCQNMAINMITWNVEFLDETGNIPFSLGRFAMVRMEKMILTFGGVDASGMVTGCAYCLDASPLTVLAESIGRRTTGESREDSASPVMCEVAAKATKGSGNTEGEKAVEEANSRRENERGREKVRETHKTNRNPEGALKKRGASRVPIDDGGEKASGPEALGVDISSLSAVEQKVTNMRIRRILSLMAENAALENRTAFVSTLLQGRASMPGDITFKIFAPNKKSARILKVSGSASLHDIQSSIKSAIGRDVTLYVRSGPDERILLRDDSLQKSGMRISSGNMRVVTVLAE